jgi:hypothetical protein
MLLSLMLTRHGQPPDEVGFSPYQYWRAARTLLLWHGRTRTGRPPSQATARPSIGVKNTVRTGRDKAFRVVGSRSLPKLQLPNENRFHRFFSSEWESFATSVLWNGGFGRIP